VAVLPANLSDPPRRRDATLEEFELSAPEKREAGLLLLDDLAQRFLASGTYLLGYVAEVRLKCAYFRFKEGASLQAKIYEVDSTKLRAAKQEASRLAALVNVTAPDAGSYHSLQFWAFLLRESRIDQGKAWESSFDQEFRACTDRLHNNWNVAMRYFPDTSLTLDSSAVQDDVLWLDTNYKILWED
jgi:hypothetical protein